MRADMGVQRECRLTDKKIVASLQDRYGLTIDNATFLPIGSDFNTAVYPITKETKHIVS